MIKENIGYVWEPKWTGKEFWVATCKQRGISENFVVVCCSPSMNGVYRYEAMKTWNFELVENNGMCCYKIPIEACKKIRELDDLKNPVIIDAVIKEQHKWLKYERKNGRHMGDEPEWFLKKGGEE